MTLNQAIQTMVTQILSILDDTKATIYLYGSAALGDFKLGWSDIDIIALTEHEPTDQQADTLVNLRQEMLKQYPDNPYFQLFEGSIRSQDAFLNNKIERTVYWGTSGQRITDTYNLDSFTTTELIENRILLCGEDILAGQLTYPTHDAFKSDIRHHYHAIRAYAQITSGEITSCGWMLDIARGLYTLKTNTIIAKTAAGEWAIAEGLAPDADVLKRVLQIRNNPLCYMNDADTLEWCATLGVYIQAFADVLKKELKNEHGKNQI